MSERRDWYLFGVKDGEKKSEITVAMAIQLAYEDGFKAGEASTVRHVIRVMKKGKKVKPKTREEVIKLREIKWMKKLGAKN